MKKLAFTISFILILGIQFGFSNESLSQFQKATAAYDSSNYSDAIWLYNNLLQEDIISSDLHYNLGNAYFKLNDVPRAILNYEKALKIDPNNEDAAYNLSLANAKTVDKIEGIPDLFLYRWWKAVFNLFAADTWAKITVSLLFIAVVFFALYFFSAMLGMKKLGFYLGVIFIALGFVSWFLAAQQNSYLNTQQYAIIIEPTVNINSSPSAGSSKLFVLHEGTKVKIEDQTNDWLEVSIPNGNKGWIEAELLEGI